MIISVTGPDGSTRSLDLDSGEGEALHVALLEYVRDCEAQQHNPLLDRPGRDHFTVRARQGRALLEFFRMPCY